jgi:hypothetical protein
VDFAQALHQARSQGSEGLAAAGAAGNLRLALALDKVGEAVLECSGELDHVDVTPSWARNNQGLKTWQLLRAADSEICPAAQRVRAARAARSAVMTSRRTGTVRAEGVLAPDSTVLARKLNVIVIDQRFDADVKRFGADIQAAVEARHRDTGIKPKL